QRSRSPLGRGSEEPIRKRRGASPRGVEHGTLQAMEAEVVLQTAGVLQRRDLHLRIRAECDRSAGLLELECRDDSVAEVALGGGAGADVRLRPAERLDLALVQVNGVDGGETRVEDALAFEELHRTQTVLCQTFLDLARLF